jgi:predicted nucleic acid-binding protein
MSSLSAVIDSNLAVYCVLNTPHSEQAARLLEQLRTRQAILYAPGLWWYEVTSVIHRYWFERLITDDIAFRASEIITVQFDVQPVQVNLRSAFDWASRLHQKAAYDGFYLAAAEQLGAELWTADEALVNNAQQIGTAWVHWMGEIQ